MEIKIYMDEQSDPKRKAKFRIRAMEGKGQSRVTKKAMYLLDKKEAIRIKKHLTDLLNPDTFSIPDDTSSQSKQDYVAVPPSSNDKTGETQCQY